MMFVLCSDITIGNKRFTAVNEVSVKRSIYMLAARATIKLPVTAIIRQKGEPATKIETAQAVAVGDRVEIRLGYDNRLRVEFRGYVKSINLRTPIEIECEDEYYMTRKRTVKSGGTTTLSDLLKKCELQVAYAETLTMRNFAVPNQSVAAVLAKITKDYGLSVFFDLDGKVYACRPEKVVGDIVKYVLRGNVINDDNLQYQNKDDVKLQIKAVCFKKDGTKVEATKGTDGGTERTLYFYDVESMSELATLAQRELERFSYDGYDGSITTFLEPYSAPAMVAELTDPLYAERSGKYYIESVETTFSMSGARRKVELGSVVR